MIARTWSVALALTLLIVVWAGTQQPTSASDPEHPCDLVASTQGHDGAAGTLEDPVKKVQELADRLTSGQTGCLRGTTATQPFAENVIVTDKSAPQGEANRITIRGYPGEVAKLRGRLVIDNTAKYITVKGLVLDGTPAAGPSPRVDGDYATFEDNNVTNAASACFRAGVLPGGTYTTTVRFQRNRIHNCKFEGINLARTFGAITVSNLIYDNGAFGLKLQPEADYSWIYQNILDGNKGGISFGGDATRSSDNNLFDSNIVHSASNWNVGYTYTSPFVPMTNSVWRDCVFSPTNPNGGLQTSPQPQGYQTFTPIVISEPVYKDRAKKDFHPANPSDPCFQYSGDVAQVVEDGGGPNDEQASASNAKPNILFIVTDDQRADGTLLPEVMPNTLQLLKDAGTDFTNAYATTPLCCPSRSSIFSGRYAHNHKVLNNEFTANLDHSATLQAYVKSRVSPSYHTGIFGKFLNEWNLMTNPPNWDEWAVLNSEYCPFLVREGNERKRYPPVEPNGFPPAGECNPNELSGSTGPSPYSTDYVAEKASKFIDEANARDDSQPWFAYIAPFAPHGDVEPAGRDHDASVPDFTETLATFEQDMSDKPDWIAAQHTTREQVFGNPNSTNYYAQSGDRKLQLRSLMAVDDLVKKLFDTLKKDGEQDTLVVFIGDNGYLWGEHGLRGKGSPYTESIRVPLFMRYAPRTTPGLDDGRVAANIDLMPTVLDLLEIGLDPQNDTAPDGLSLLQNADVRDRILTEQKDTWATNTRDWASTRTLDYQYIEHYDEDGTTIIFQEYYDLRPGKDPLQLDNLYGDDGIPDTDDDSTTNQPLVPAQTLKDQLRKDRLCQDTGHCPPGAGADSLTDAKSPSVSVIAPSTGSRMSGKHRLRAMAFDNLGVDRVDFWLDTSGGGTLLDSVHAGAPWDTIWDTTQVSDGSHEISAIAWDKAGHPSGESTIFVTVDNGDGVDVQIDNNPDNPPGSSGKVNGQPKPDSITYSFGESISAGALVENWNGSRPDCPQTGTAPLGCVTVALQGDDQLLGRDHDSLRIYRDDVPSASSLIQELGSIDLGDDDYMSVSPDALTHPIYIPSTRAAMELFDGGRRLKITLGYGQPAATGTGVSTAVWSNAFCGCQVPESIEPTDASEDREF